MDINKHQVYSHWLSELSTISNQEFFPTFRQFLNLLVIENPEKIRKLEEEYEKEYIQLNKLGEEAVNEIEPLFNKIEGEASKAQIPLSIDAVRYKQIKRGEVLTSESLPDALYHAIRTTLEMCKNTGKLKIFDNLMSEREGFWYLDYDKATEVFPTYRNYQIQSRKYEEKEKEEIWGLYNSLKGYITFFKEIFPEEAGIMTKGEIINKLKRLVLYLLTPEEREIEETELPFDDTATRRAFEQKWDALQSIWEVYESHSRPDCIFVPVARLTVKDRSVELIDGVIDGFKRESFFKDWERKDRWYDLQFINHELLPKKYEELGNNYKKLATSYQEQNKSEAPSDTSVPINKPYCIVERRTGYLKFGKHGTKKKIGLATGRPFRLIQCLLEPISLAKTIDAVFEAIRQQKDKDDHKLLNWNTAQARKIEIIQYAIKELQKIGKLKDKEKEIKFCFNENNTQLKAEFIS
ncbi:hypothetical protein HYT74_01275 [Candidatus Daviesbacteria bacterium]|nr:hypothetical protein [Candidatus Daviesbacteria bacterium]